jgi:hypothetical protein
MGMSTSTAPVAHNGATQRCRKQTGRKGAVSGPVDWKGVAGNIRIFR